MTEIEAIWSRSIAPDATADATLKQDGGAYRSHDSLSLHCVRVAGPGDTMEPPPHFALKKRLGEGGMGVVFDAVQLCLNRSVAIKALKPESADSELRRKIFLTEAATTGALDHPNIPAVHDLAMDDQGRPFLVMKKVEGRPWNEIIRANSLRENLEILSHVADGVAFAHSRGIIHRDIKPANVMIGAFGEIYLMDWGLAVSVTGEGRAARLAASVAAGGTAAYMAPEMACAEVENIGPLSDVYLLGAVLYEIVIGKPPHAGRTVAETLLAAANNLIAPPEQTGELANIAMTAMASDPADRFPDCKAFQESIRDYLAHEESLTLVQLAETALEKGRQTGDYAGFVEAVADLDRALKLWPENERARDTLGIAKLGYAEVAFRHDDLDLARSLLDANDPRHAPLLRQVREAVAARAAAARRAKRILWAAGLAGAVILGFAAYLGFDYLRYFGRWHVVYDQDFTSPKADTKGLAFFSIYAELEQRPATSKAGVLLPAEEMFWLRDAKLPGDVRVEMRVRWPDVVDSLQILVNARHDPGNILSTNANPICYNGQFGAYSGAICDIARCEDARVTGGAFSVPADLLPGQIYQIAFERLGETVSLYVDGKRVNRVADPLPLLGERLESVGARAWADVEIHSLRVLGRSLPEKCSPLVAAESLFRRGHLEDAIAAYRELAEHHKGTAIAEKALAGAYLALNRLPEPPEGTKAEVLQRMKSDHPHSPYLAKMLEADCVTAWRGGDHRRAFAMLPQVFARDPEIRAVLRMLSGPHEPLPEPVADELLRWVAKTRRVGMLNISNLGLRSLARLAGMKLTALDCRNNRITDLGPLKGWPLKALSFSSNKVENLEPLSGMPLGSVDCSNNEIVDLAPLQNANLQRLSCNGNRVINLEPLRTMRLWWFDANGNPLRDLNPLRGQPLTYLRLNTTEVASLEPIRGMKLREICIAETQVSDLSPLAGMPIQKFDAAFSQVSDLAPLANMPLRSVRIGGTHVRDLGPLAGAPLVVLVCDGCPVTDLEPLRGSRLQRIACSRTQITSLAPLAGIPLWAIQCSDTPLTSLMPFEESPPAHFVFDSPVLPDDYLGPLLDGWEKRGDRGDVVRQARLERALRAGDRNELKKLAARHDGHRYALSLRQFTFAEAMALAESVGGHLVTIHDAAENEFARSLLASSASTAAGISIAWLGLKTDRTGPTWVTGEPLAFDDFRSREKRDSAQAKILVALSRGQRLWGELPPDCFARAIIEWDE